MPCRSLRMTEPKMTDESFVNIGASFGGKNHTTMIHAYEKTDKMRKEDSSFDNLLLEMEEHFTLPMT